MIKDHKSLPNFRILGVSRIKLSKRTEGKRLYCEKKVIVIWEKFEIQTIVYLEFFEKMNK